MFGFIGKELLYTTKISIENVGAWLILAAVVANVALVASALMVSVKPFLGRLQETPKKPHEAPLSMLVGPVVLAGLGLLRGLQPEPFETEVGSAAASAVLGETVTMKLKLWHGLDPSALAVMGLSLLTLAAGYWLFTLVRVQVTPIGAAMCRAAEFGPARWYEVGLAGLYRGADRVTRLIQHGYLRYYLFATLGVALVVATVPLVRAMPLELGADTVGWHVHEVVVALMVPAGAILAAVLLSRLASVAALGSMGAAIAVLFMLFSAPDLAMTQMVVEILTVVLLVLVFYHLPAMARRSGAAARSRDLLLAIGFGTLMSVLVLAVAAMNPAKDAYEYFLAASYPAAQGRNIVNVILVDFRAMDTLGEIVVLAVAGLGVFALLRLRPTRREDKP
jgi:multicomponent Na+:H+ antiporter subunit A